MSVSGRLRKGPILAAAGALALLAGAIGYRVATSEDAAGSDPGAISAPPAIEELRARAEAAPDDPAAWQRLGFAYFQEARFAEAAEAYRKAVAAEPGSAVLWSSLGEALVMASTSDPLPEPALEAFRRALEEDPADPRARYFLAVERDLTGDHDGAIEDWLALLADTPPGAPWEADLVRTIEQVGAINEIAVEERIAGASATRDLLPAAAQPPALQGIPGPSQQQLAAASALPPDQQQDMAEGMVARLAARLEGDPADVEGWMMLMRSYKMLGRDAAARDALARGIEANPAAATRLRKAASVLGI